MDASECIIIALGKGIDAGGDLSNNTISNAEKAIRLYNSGISKIILFSGGYSYKLLLKSYPKSRESVEMKKLAVKSGIPESEILCETESLDTSGNAMYSFDIVSKMKGIKKILLVTSPEHMERALFLFKLAFQGYEITPMASPSTLQEPELKAAFEAERKNLANIKAQFSKFDSKQMGFEKIVRKINPLYACDLSEVPEEAMEYLKGIGFTRDIITSKFTTKNRQLAACKELSQP